MATLKLTKNELRGQQNRLGQLEKYLPTLQLKKAMLQAEMNEVRLEIAKLQQELTSRNAHVQRYAALLTELDLFLSIDVFTKAEKINKRYDNIAGVVVPYLESVKFYEGTYNLLETPPWTEACIEGMRQLSIVRIKITIAEEKYEALRKEQREVSIRVNLFEKVLIPRALKNIAKIKVFLGDQQLAAVAQAKVAKRKIEEHACV